MRHTGISQGSVFPDALGISCLLRSTEDDTSIAAHLLRLLDPATGLPLSDERLLPEIATLLIAGFDTSAHTMSWTLVGVPVCFKPSQRCLSWRLFTSAVHLLS